MRKIMLLAAMLAMVLAITVPAMADNSGGDQSAVGCVAVQAVDQRVQQDATGGAGGAGGDAGDVNAGAIQIPVAISLIPILSPGDVTATAAQYAVSQGGAGGAGGDAVNVVTLDATQDQNCDSTIGQYQAVASDWWWE